MKENSNARKKQGRDARNLDGSPLIKTDTM